ncbi:hypothetical protein L4D20_04365 [Vibrio kyushuensis]|uniref:hypothetical protein n=1 Tax=Vibrio kyushuensis TaxID=2910249 RepID=UPI003D13BC76
MEQEGYAVIVENDESAWKDQTGVKYHFPKIYIAKSRIRVGTKVVYYKGRMTNSKFANKRLSKQPHYFGFATVCAITPDPLSKKGDLYAELEGFTAFDKAVPFKFKGSHIESHTAKNYFRDAVRKIDKNAYVQILSLAQMESKSSAEKADSNTGYGKSWEVVSKTKAIKYIDSTLINYSSTRLPKSVRSFFTAGLDNTELKATFRGDLVSIKVVKSVDKKGVTRFDLRFSRDVSKHFNQTETPLFLSFDKTIGKDNLSLTIVDSARQEKVGIPKTNSCSIDIETVDIEVDNDQQFMVKGTGERTGNRSESCLVKEYCEFKKIVKPKRNKISFGDGNPLYTDLFLDDYLFEAKSTSDRTAVRMAIGQLFDYENLLGKDVKKVVLLPCKPSSTLEELILKLNFGLVYKDERTFVEENL